VEKSTGQYRGYLAIPLADANSGTEDDEIWDLAPAMSGIV
jgi:hypothetical protein